MKKRMAALGVAVVLGLSLFGCAKGINLFTSSKFDAVAYMWGHMDLLYHGEYSQDFMRMVDSTEVEAQEIYENSIAAAVEHFFDWVAIEYPTEEMTTHLSELYKQIYAKADYTVVSSAKQKDDSYIVKLTVRPLNIMQQFNEAYPAFSEAFMADFAEVNTDAMTQGEYDTWYETTFDQIYANAVMGLLESLIPGICRMEEQSILVQIEKDSTDSLYVINANDLSNLDDLIIDYTQSK